MDIGKPKKIFIVDDDTLLTEALQEYLTRSVPHNILTFNTGEECLHHLFESPDIIILDYYLNSVQKDAANGLEILKSIKNKFRRAHVIMLSSRESYKTAMETLQIGAEQYIIKDKDAFEKIAALINELN